jgi:hypothetical protein
VPASFHSKTKKTLALETALQEPQNAQLRKNPHQAEIVHGADRRRTSFARIDQGGILESAQLSSPTCATAFGNRLASCVHRA